MAEETQHNSLVNQLTRLVENLRGQNNAAQSRVQNTDARAETVGQAISRLFPTVRARTSGNTAHPGVATSQQSQAPTRFQPTQTRAAKGRKPYAKKTTSNPSPAVVKDVILLPNPRIKTVPRGRTREELYARGFVASAFSITNELSESEILSQFNALFNSKLRGSQDDLS